MRTKITTTVVSSCRNACPFFQVVDMEHIMLCGHPHWLGHGAYAGTIITHENSNDRVPDECPLRKGEARITQVVKLRDDS